MNDAEVSKQILQMVQFIKQEAEEKASEIAVAAEEEFNIEKLQIVEAEKQKIRKEYERKEGLVDVKKKMCERQPHARECGGAAAPAQPSRPRAALLAPHCPSPLAPRARAPRLARRRRRSPSSRAAAASTPRS